MQPRTIMMSMASHLKLPYRLAVPQTNTPMCPCMATLPRANSDVGTGDQERCNPTPAQAMAHFGTYHSAGLCNLALAYPDAIPDNHRHKSLDTLLALMWPSKHTRVPFVSVPRERVPATGKLGSYEYEFVIPGSARCPGYATEEREAFHAALFHGILFLAEARVALPALIQDHLTKLELWPWIESSRNEGALVLATAETHVVVAEPNVSYTSNALTCSLYKDEHTLLSPALAPSYKPLDLLQPLGIDHPRRFSVTPIPGGKYRVTLATAHATVAGDGGSVLAAYQAAVVHLLCLAVRGDQPSTWGSVKKIAKQPTTTSSAAWKPVLARPSGDAQVGGTTLDDGVKPGRDGLGKTANVHHEQHEQQQVQGSQLEGRSGLIDHGGLTDLRLPPASLALKGQETAPTVLQPQPTPHDIAQSLPQTIPRCTLPCPQEGHQQAPTTVTERATNAEDHDGARARIIQPAVLSSRSTNGIGSLPPDPTVQSSSVKNDQQTNSSSSHDGNPHGTPHRPATHDAALGAFSLPLTYGDAAPTGFKSIHFGSLMSGSNDSLANKHRPLAETEQQADRQSHQPVQAHVLTLAAAMASDPLRPSTVWDLEPTHPSLFMLAPALRAKMRRHPLVATWIVDPFKVMQSVVWEKMRVVLPGQSLRVASTHEVTPTGELIRIVEWKAMVQIDEATKVVEEDAMSEEEAVRRVTARVICGWF